MNYIYTATFITEDNTVYARVPDIPGCITTGRDLADAIDMITDAACLCLVVLEDRNIPIPEPTPQHLLSVPAGAQCSLIQIDTLAYRARTDSRSVRKNVSVPAWMAAMADKQGLNCSKLLQDALMKKLRSTT